jgi:hypothetical protein
MWVDSTENEFEDFTLLGHPNLLLREFVGLKTSVDGKFTYASSNPDIGICIFLMLTYISTDAHLNCWAVFYSSTCYEIFMQNSYQEQLEMCDKIRCDVQQQCGITISL